MDEKIGDCGDGLADRARKGWQHAVRQVARKAAQWIHAGVRVAGDAEDRGQGRWRCDAGALGGRHVTGKSIRDSPTHGGQEVGRSSCQDLGRA